MVCSFASATRRPCVGHTSAPINVRRICDPSVPMHRPDVGTKPFYATSGRYIGPTLAPNRCTRRRADTSARHWLPTVACDFGADASARYWLSNIVRDVGCRCVGSTLAPDINASYDGVRPPADVVRSKYDVGLRMGLNVNLLNNKG